LRDNCGAIAAYARRMEGTQIDTGHMEPAQTAPRPRHDIPSLDGLRAVSIAIVILSHTRALWPARLVDAGLVRYVIGGGLHGVQIFFAISGYLITTLLLREYEQRGDVSFRRFYARRALRIFPAFYVYFGVVALLCAAGVVAVHWPTYFASATYSFVYMPHPQGWYVEHAWSLSIEEQFYLLWPAVLVFAHRRGHSLHAVLGILAAMPFVRVLLALVVAAPERILVSVSSIDMLMAGCLLALLPTTDAWPTIMRRFSRGWIVVVCMMVGFVVVPYAGAKVVHGPAGLLTIALGTTVVALAIVAMLVFVVTQPQSMAGHFLNLRFMRHLGVLSYSLYLWQQLFTADPRRFGFAVYLLILGTGELSFFLIERPILRLRARLGV
jgi:peptidoglycan/LPS O-acetylase OafA/YrhL